MKILAFDTATDACTIALMLDDELLSKTVIAPQQHAKLMLPMIDELLDKSGIDLKNLDGIAFGRGPGSFTGLRIGAGLAQGLAFGAGLSVAPVSTLAAVAQGAKREKDVSAVIAILDARMQEIYWATYQSDDQGLMHIVGKEVVCPPDQAPAPETGEWYVAGPGWSAYRSVLSDLLGNVTYESDGERMPDAQDIAVLGADLLNKGEDVARDKALPVYIRNQVAVAMR